VRHWRQSVSCEHKPTSQSGVGCAELVLNGFVTSLGQSGNSEVLRSSARQEKHVPVQLTAHSTSEMDAEKPSGLSGKCLSAQRSPLITSHSELTGWNIVLPDEPNTRPSKAINMVHRILKTNDRVHKPPPLVPVLIQLHSIPITETKWLIFYYLAIYVCRIPLRFPSQSSLCPT
jgi:hypothetical protein